MGPNKQKDDYLIRFIGDGEIELFHVAKNKAREMDVPLKIIIIDALNQWVNGQLSLTKVSGDYIKVRKEKIEYRKRPKNLLNDIIERENWEQ